MSDCLSNSMDDCSCPSSISTSRSPDVMTSSPSGSLRTADIPPRSQYFGPGMRVLSTNSRIHAVLDAPVVEVTVFGASGSRSSMSSSYTTTVPSHVPGWSSNRSQVALPRSVVMKARMADRDEKPPPGFRHRLRMRDGIATLREYGSRLAR